MNKEIERLWDNAALSSFSGVNESWEDRVKFVEKFAESIVRQCLFEVVHESTNHPNGEIMRFTVGVTQRIKDKFGIK